MAKQWNDDYTQATVDVLCTRCKKEVRQYYWLYTVKNSHEDIVSGYEEDDTYTFRPNAKCTRAEIVQMLYKIFSGETQ